MTNASTRVGSAVVFVSLLAMGLGGRGQRVDAAHRRRRPAAADVRRG